MNAYELAEKAQGLAYEIPADWSSGEPKNVATDIANMLRQQADRIAELEKELKHYKMAWNMAENELENQTKPLSDDEIKEIADSVCYLIDKDKKDRTRGVMYIEDFARAIEERHGIK